METKMMMTNINQNDIFSSIEKIHPTAGDVLIFTFKTDSNGDPLVPIEDVYNISKTIEAVIGASIAVLFIPDTIFFEKCDDAEAAIHNLENIIYLLKDKKG